MPFRLNPISGNLDLVGSSGGGSGNVTGESPTTINAISRWDDTSGETIKDSNTIIQDSGAIDAQGFLSRRSVTSLINIPAGESWIAPNLQLETTGSIQIESDAELIII